MVKMIQLSNLQYIAIIVSMLLTGITVGYSLGSHKVLGIYEDQIRACNFMDECIDIDLDDFMSKEKSDLLWDLYKNNIDTYSVSDLN